MLSPEILAFDSAQEEQDPSDWTLLAEPIPRPWTSPPWARPSSDRPAESQSLNGIPIDSSLESSIEIGYSNEFNSGSLLARENDDSSNTNGFDQVFQQPINKPTAPANLLRRKISGAAKEWDRRKQNGESSGALDELMQYQGLEEVKQHFLDIKSKVNICKKQDPEGIMNVLRLERFNVVFQGNPGTGKHVATLLFV